MEKKEYLVGVTVLEARGIRGLDRGNTSDPFVKVICGNLSPQVTKVHYETNSAVWN